MNPTKPRPIFIIGAPRSGTSVLTWCIGQHSNVSLVPETNWLAALGSQLDHFYALGTANGRYSHLSRLEVSREEFFASFGPAIDKLIKDAFERKYAPERERLRRGGEPEPIQAWVRSADDPKQRWVDGTPANSAYVAAFALIFPDAQFVHLTRDPDAALRSLVSHETLSAQFADTLTAVQYIFHSRRAAHLAEIAFGRDKVIRADLDRILADPDGELARIVAHLGEAYEPACKLPLMKKINQTEESRKQAASIALDEAGTRFMDRLRGWQHDGADPSWVLPVDPEFAREELETYSSIPVNRPPSSRQFRLD
jgi:hypothetical protein